MSRPPSIRSLGADSALERWAAAGLAELTGPPEGPGLGPPAGFVARLDALCERIEVASGRVGGPVRIDGMATLAARAQLMGLRRRGRVSCGGACHLVRGRDGWLAVSLSREDDWELLPAWIGASAASSDGWAEVHDRCAERPVAEMVAQGALLGLPIAALAEANDGRATDPVRWTSITSTEPSRAADGGRPVRVVDLSSMWAGPLCGAVLAATGAEVVKVESLGRPDGTRVGSPDHYARLNGGKELRTLDLTTAAGLAELRSLLASADVVIESSRPRALRQMGIDAEEVLSAADGPRLWISITGHGRGGDPADRVALGDPTDRGAFGDDAAVAGGLVAWWNGEPTFCADAVADPLTGLVAAAALLEAFAAGHRGLLDIAMAQVAAHFAGSPTPDRCAPGGTA